MRPWSLRGILDPARKQSPSVDRAAEICRAVGLEFYIGPPRGDGGPVDERFPIVSTPALTLSRDIEVAAQSMNRAIVAMGGDPIPEDLWQALDERRVDTSASAPADIASDEHQPEVSLGIDEDVVLVDFAENIRAAAGSGAMVFEEAADLQVAVPRTFLPRWVSTRGLICIRAAGDSMQPMLNDGDLILLDRSQIEPVDGKMFVLHTEDGLVVKRLRVSVGGWTMTSDNPAYLPRPIGKWDHSIGRVAWSGPLPATKAHGGKKQR